MTDKLPEKFIERMKTQLPESEWSAFFAVYDNPPKKGLRVNLLKCQKDEFLQKSPYKIKEVAWEENGFLVEEEKIGAHPYHFAGVYYSQEPSAMCAAPLLDVQAGERVLDLCSAPGGKGTQLAGKMDGKGIIVLNEPVLNRAKILLQNVERLGVKNAVVISALPEKISTFFKGYVDKILIDAPCSGEGMFRKNADEALKEWSEENVALCAQRQQKILDEGVKMLRVGGRLVYSTCTFASEEDEGQVTEFLQNHPEMRLIRQEKLYPHKVDGEGHFAALFEKTAGGEECYLREIKPRVTPLSEKAYRAFEKDVLKIKMNNLYEKDGVLYALPDKVFDFTSLNILRVGVRLGEVRNGRFEPSHALAMCLVKEQIKRVADFSLDDSRLEKFLRGESVEDDGENGWTAVLADGFTIGWGKRVNGVLKNHIPKALRKMS